MATINLHIILLAFSLTTFYSLAFIAPDDACLYPCNPPPIAGTITPPTPTTQTGSYPPPTYSLPPPSGNLPNYPPPSGNLPNYPPPYGNFPNYPPGGSYDAGSITMPPPPDPILPYFPYYYRNGARRPSDQYSSSTAFAAVPRSTVKILFASIVVVLSSSLVSLFLS